MATRFNKLCFLLCSAILVCVGVIYLQGLGSRFIFDDNYNLQGLADIESHGWLYYIFGSGFSGPGGRPLSLFTFALQYQDWPDNPFAFKFINLSIHLINAILVFLFSRLLMERMQKDGTKCLLFAMIVMMLWTVLPVHVNTILYTIQRMTLISATFTLIGLICFIHGRNQIIRENFKIGFVWIIFSIFACSLFAILAKETGILLPVFLILIEFLFYKDLSSSKIKKIIWLLLSIPLAFFCFYIFLNIESLVANFYIREFTPLQRVLTESRVIMDYIAIVLIPQSGVFSLFHDGYPVSTSIVTPFTTFISIVIIAFTILLAFTIHKSYPVVGFGLLFFFAGHALEAGPISLDLYFEHRNYLPSLGLIIVISSLIAAGLSQIKFIKYLSGFLALYFLVLAAILFDQVTLWNKPYEQTIMWSKYYPQSKRAKQELVNIHLDYGNYPGAMQVLDELGRITKNDIYPDVRRMHIESCILNQDLLDTKLNQLSEKAQLPIKYNIATISVIDYLVLDIIKDECSGLMPEDLEKLISLLISNQNAYIDKDILYELLSTLAIYKGNYEAAIVHLRKSISANFNVDKKLREIALLKELKRENEVEFAIHELNDYMNENLKARLAYDYSLRNLE